MPCTQDSQARLINAGTFFRNAVEDALQEAQLREAPQPHSVAFSLGAKRSMQGLFPHYYHSQL